MPYRENISYLVPRDPSIQCWEDRVQLSGPRTKNLIQLGLDKLEETMGGGKIKVYLRLKPSMSSCNTYTVLDSNTLQTEAPKDSVSYKNVTNGIGKLIHKFTFTSVLDSSVTQSDLFKKCAVKNITKFLNGENYLLMAYGTTSAGKTYTMQGNVDRPGVIPRALDFVFNNLKSNIVSQCPYQPHQYNELISLSDDQLRKDQAHKNFILSLDLSKCQRYPDASHVTLQTNSSSGFSEIYENATFKLMQTRLTDSLELESLDIESTSLKYSIWISMIEIYNEQVYDLLELPNEKGVRTKLNFRDDENGNTFVKNLRYVNVSSGHEAFQILQFGRTNLHFAPTALNQSSSRSHCIFTITLAKFLDYESSSCAIMSRFSFCDLAGMERAKKTLNSKDRLVESKAINTSLSILVKCLTTIKENQNNKEKKLIPYRESKLTKLFREAVTGKGQFSLIVNVTTEANLFDETLNVLKFSAIAQKIVPQNVFVKPKMVKPLKKSRFSQLVTNCSYNSRTIDWDATTVDGSKMKEESTSEIVYLQELVEKLQEELAKERKRCSDIEDEIREELTTKFSEMLKKQRDNNEERLESERERLEEMYERKEKRLIRYYEILQNNKRRRLEEEESKEYEDQERKMEDLQRENEALKSKNQALSERIQKVTEELNRAVAECSALKFAAAEKNRLFDELKKTVDAKTAGEDCLVAELRRQLDDAKKKMADYKVLLDEAAVDYKELEESNRYLRNENEVLEQCLTEQRDAVADHLSEISELQKVLTNKRIAMEKLEDANEKLSQEVKDLAAASAEAKDEKELSIADVYKKELDSLREQFMLTSAKLCQSRSELETCKSDKSKLEAELRLCNAKIEELQKEMIDTGEKFSAKMGSEVDKLSAELESATNERETLRHKCNELTSEVELLQKELKNLLGKVGIGRESELEKELSDVKEKLNNEIENLKAREREAKAVVDALSKSMPQLEEENKLLRDEIEVKERDLKKAVEARVGLFAEHEKKASQLKEENERLRGDVSAVMESLRSWARTDSSPERENEIRKLLRVMGVVEEIKAEPEKEMIESKENEETECEKQEQETISGQSDSSPEKARKRGKNESTQKLARQLENLTLQPKSTRKKVDLLDDSVHPSAIKKTNRKKKNQEKGKKEKEAEKEEEKEPTSSVKKKGKCFKKLFTENDFDGLTDLNASPIEYDIPRLRPRK